MLPYFYPPLVQQRLPYAAKSFHTPYAAKSFHTPYAGHTVEKEGRKYSADSYEEFVAGIEK